MRMGENRNESDNPLAQMKLFEKEDVFTLRSWCECEQPASRDFFARRDAMRLNASGNRRKWVGADELSGNKVEWLVRDRTVVAGLLPDGFWLC